MKNILAILLLCAMGYAYSQQNTDYKITNTSGTNGRARLIMGISDRIWHLENDGNLDLFKIRDQSAPADRFVIDYSGNIGMGITAPARKLHVYGGSSSFPQLRVHEEGGNNSVDVGHDGTNGIIRTNEGGILLEGGNIGIGTSLPSTLLHLSSVGQNTDLTLSNENGTTGRNRILLSISDRAWNIENDGNLNLFKIRDQTAGEDRIVINYNGNVGIGTPNPANNYKLSVNGAIRSKEVKVEADWPDFVFERDYELRSLEEVEEHIAEKGHLPEIPSEADVNENGINLGEMNAKLLQKIEELTLYLIDQNKEIQELRKEVSALKNQ